MYYLYICNPAFISDWFLYEDNSLREHRRHYADDCPRMEFTSIEGITNYLNKQSFPAATYYVVNQKLNREATILHRNINTNIDELVAI